MLNIEAYKLLNNIIEIEKSTEIFPVRISYKIIKNRILLLEKLKPYLEIRDRIIHKYDPSGEVKKENPNYLTCLEELKPIDNEKIDITFEDKISLNDIKELNLPINIISIISPMIKEE